MSKYNIVVYGATGFTGKLICKYLSSSSEASNLSWAIAGRNEGKLSDLSKKYSVDYIRCDSFNKEQLDAMCSSADLVISTVGPYDVFGDLLVISCIDNKSHYLDLTGENIFVKRIFNEYSNLSIDNDVIIMHCCGFDSLPPDLCTFLALEKIECDAVDITYNIKTKGKISGGTWASVLNISSKPAKSIKKEIKAKNSKLNHKILSFCKDLNRWRLFFPTIDTYICLKTISSQYPNIKKKTFSSFLVLPSYLSGFMLVCGLAIISILSRFRIFKNILEKIKPSGSGPSKKERETHWFKSEVVAATDKNKVIATMSGGDPGYDETAKFISELALCVINDYEKLNIKNGILTPMECAGHLIVDRLKANGIEIEVREKS